MAGGADLELDLLGRLLADQELVLALDVVDDRLVHLVAADAQRLRDDDAAERDDGDLGRAAADVDDHVAGRLGDGQPGADRGGHGLLDEVRLARAGREGRFLDGALLDAGHARGHAHDDARVREAVLVHLLDEVAQHLLGHVEVGDDAVLERPDGRDVARRAAEHPLGLDADGVHLAVALVDRDDRRLGEDDAAAADVHECVRGAEVDGHVTAAEAGQSAEKVHAAPLYRHKPLIPLSRSAILTGASMNIVTLIGNLATDVELRDVGSREEGGKLSARGRSREQGRRRRLRERLRVGSAGGAVRRVPRQGPARRGRRLAEVALVGGGRQAAHGAIEVVARRVEFLGGGPRNDDADAGGEVIPFEAPVAG